LVARALVVGLFGPDFHVRSFGRFDEITYLVKMASGLTPAVEDIPPTREYRHAVPVR